MKKEKSTLAGFGAALLAILGSITCCGAPIAAGILASVGIGASQLEFLNTIQPYLIAIALISLGIGFYRLYFKKNTSCCGPNPGETPPSNKKSKIFLWIVTIFTIGMLIYTNKPSQATEETCCPAPQAIEAQSSCSSCSPSSSAQVLPKTSQTQSSCCGSTINKETVKFKLDGLSKSCCIKPLVKKLREESRINNFAIQKEKDLVIVSFEKQKINEDEINTLLSSSGFKVDQVQ